MISSRSLQHRLPPGLAWALVLLLAVAVLAPATAHAFDHPRDDGHSRRSDPDDPPDPDEPPDEPEDECTGTSSPVYLSEGTLFLSRVDLEVDSHLPISVHRSYNHRDDRNGMAGRGWTHSYELRAIPITDGDQQGAIVRWLNGQRQTFVRQPDGTYARPLGCPATLEADPAGFEIRRTANISYRTDADGTLESIVDRNGVSADFENDPVKGCVDAISFRGGRIEVTYGPNGRIATITAPGGRSVSYDYDASGNLVGVTGPAGHTTTYAYDSQNRLTEIRDPMGRTTLSVTYDSQNRVRRLVDYEGDFTYSYGSGQTTKTDNATGGRWTYRFDARGVITSVTDPLGHTTSKQFDSLYNLVAETDANGNTTSYSYDLAGNVLSKTNPMGDTTSWTYTASGLVQTMTDPLGVVTRFERDANGNVLRRIEGEGTPEERVWTYQYDAAGNVISETDPDGRTTTHTYDAAGNRTSTTDPMGNTTTFGYDAAGNRTRVTDPRGNTTTRDYDAARRVTLVEDDLGVVEERTYDAAGNLASRTDGRGNTETFTHDRYGRRTRAVDKEGGERTWEYGPFGVTRFTNADGEVTLVEYDLAGRIERQTVKLNGSTGGPDSDDQVVTYTRDPNGNPVALTDANGNTVSHGYDALDRRVSTTLPSGDGLSITYSARGRIVRQQIGAGRHQEMDYDAVGRLVERSDDLGVLETRSYADSDLPVSRTDAEGDVFTFSYDAAGRTTTRGYPDGSTETFTYDAAGELVAVTDRNGQQVTFTRDLRGRIVGVTTATGETISATYDGNGNLASVTDANGNTTAYTYDAEDRRTAVTHPDGTVETSTYDAEGRLVERTRRDGTTVRFEYDARGRVVLRDFPGSNDDVYTWGPAGELLRAANANATVQFTYDADGRVVREEVNGRAVQYSYDAPNLRTTITYPGGRSVTHVLDVRERLTRIEDGGGSAIATFDYTPSNDRALQTNANGTSSDWTYDATGRVVELGHASGGSDLLRLLYAYNPGGRAVQAVNQTDASASETYSYDADDRLLEFRRGVFQSGGIGTPDRSVSYSLDPVGNWTSVTRDGSTESRTVGTANRYAAVDGAALTYDAFGNLTGDGERLFAYDAAGRLSTVTRASDGQVLASYEYGPLGRRLAATDASGLRTELFYDLRHNVIEEQTGGGTAATYVYGRGVDDIVSMTRNGQTFFLHRDLSQHVVAATDAAGAVAESYAYDPYGAVTVFNAAGSQITSSAIGNPLLFTGRRWDEDAGIYYFRARYYHPELGRFLSEDPAGFVDGMSLYEYATGDPVNFFDPLGLGSKSCNLSGSVEFDAASKIQSITGQFLKAFGLKFEIGGGVKLEISDCNEKCCDGETTRTVGYQEYKLEADLKMEYGGPIPGLSVQAPLIGSIGLHGKLSFAVMGGGSIVGMVDGNCNVSHSGEACGGFTGGVSLLLGGKLAEASDIDPFSGKIGIEGSGSLSGQVCYTMNGWTANACLSGAISVVAEIKVFFVAVGGKYEVVGGMFCAN